MRLSKSGQNTVLGVDKGISINTPAGSPGGLYQIDNSGVSPQLVHINIEGEEIERFNLAVGNISLGTLDTDPRDNSLWSINSVDQIGDDSICTAYHFDRQGNIIETFVLENPSGFSGDYGQRNTVAIDPADNIIYTHVSSIFGNENHSIVENNFNGDELDTYVDLADTLSAPAKIDVEYDNNTLWFSVFSDDPFIINTTSDISDGIFGGLDVISETEILPQEVTTSNFTMKLSPDNNTMWVAASEQTNTFIYNIERNGDIINQFQSPIGNGDNLATVPISAVE